MHYLELSLLAIIILFPIFDYFNAKYKSDNKTIEYIKTSGILWVLTVFMAYLFTNEKLTVLTLDYQLEFNWQNITVAVFLFLAIAYLILLIKNIINNQELRLEVVSKFQPFVDILPSTKKQVLVFTLVLSVTAGICEELIFRAYLFNFIDSQLGIISAVIMSSLVFGLWHVYLGWQEVIRTSVMGVIFCGIYIFTGNIIFPILLHIFIDVYSGLICYFAIREQPELITDTDT